MDNIEQETITSVVVPDSSGPIVEDKSSVGGSNWMTLVSMLLMFAVFYFLLIRPQEKKRKEHEQTLETIKKGEDVLTSSGIFGKVAKINDDGTLIIEIAENVTIKIVKSAIAEIISRKKIGEAPNTKVANNTLASKDKNASSKKK